MSSNYSLIVDAGSTKTDWLLVNQEKEAKQLVASKGINPVVQKTTAIQAIIQSFVNQLDPSFNITSIKYYGAGCSNKSHAEKVKDCLQQLFPTAEVAVQHDLLLAAQATCGSKQGIVCILGTGSNVCYYDGTQLVDQLGGLGYLLGDEGSGAYLGKLLVQAFLLNELPSELKQQLLAYEKLFQNKSLLLNRIYQQASPNHFLASLAPFIYQHKENEFIQSIIRASFDAFFEKNVMPLVQNYPDVPVYVIGSIGFYFKESVETVANSNSIQIERCIQKPLEV